MVFKGEIREIYLPEEYIDGKLVDELFRKHIGFKLEIDGNIYCFETEQTKESCIFFREEIVDVIVEDRKIKRLEKVEM